MEVPSREELEVVDGVPVLVFCCGWRELSSERRAEFGERDATYSVAVSADLTEVDFNRAKAFEDPLVYAARIIQGKDGWYLIGFVNEVDGQFVGQLCDPVPVSATVEVGLVRR